MKRIVLYLDPRSLNDATSYYLDIIRRAATDLGYIFHISESIKEIKSMDVILTITTNNFIKGLVLRPFCKTLFWSQGVDPEESLLRENNFFNYYAKNIIEFIALRFPGIKFFISEAMLDHYNNKYGFCSLNYIIMPCYNLHYEKSKNFDMARYEIPSFVYAGSLSIWQNIDETLQVYKLIENKIPGATLTLLTEENKKANSLIRKYNIRSANVKYVALKELNLELLKYKYGFLLRKDILVNNVATPTKMNSYLACGLIPIYTNAIKDYSENINLNNFNLKIKTTSSIAETAKTIINFENSVKDFTHLDIEIQNIFNDYYNDNKYIKQIISKLKRLENI